MILKILILGEFCFSLIILTFSSRVSDSGNHLIAVRKLSKAKMKAINIGAQYTFILGNTYSAPQDKNPPMKGPTAKPIPKAEPIKAKYLVFSFGLSTRSEMYA